MLLRDDPDNVPAPSQLRDIPIGDRGCRTGGILREPQQGDSQQACEEDQRGNRPRSAAPQTGASLSMFTMVRHGDLLALTQRLACAPTALLRADFRRGLLGTLGLWGLPLGSLFRFCLERLDGGFRLGNQFLRPLQGLSRLEEFNLGRLLPIQFVWMGRRDP